MLCSSVCHPVQDRSPQATRASRDQVRRILVERPRSTFLDELLEKTVSVHALELHEAYAHGIG